MSKPLARRPVRIVWAIAALAVPSTGTVVLQATSPSGSVLAECINGVVIDPDTGSCPQQPSISGGAGVLSNPAVEGAEAANEFSEALADQG
jgi:hypothetical protein